MSNKVMICCSTANQTVNLIPFLQLQCTTMILLSTETAGKKHWTAWLQTLMETRGFTIHIAGITSAMEKDIPGIVRLLMSTVDEIKPEKLFINIGGGQKSMTLALHQTMIALDSKSPAPVKMVYAEANNRELLIMDSSYQATRQPISVSLTLQEILGLYGYEASSYKKLAVRGDQTHSDSAHPFVANAAQLLKTDPLFSEFFIRYVQSVNPLPDTVKIQETIRKYISALQPEFEDLQPESFPDIVEFSKLRKKVSAAESQNSFTVEVAVREIKRFLYPSEIQMRYWSEFKRRLFEKVITNFTNRSEDGKYDSIIIEQPQTPEAAERLRTLWKSVGGKLSYKENAIRRSGAQLPFKTGEFFEQMVQSEVLEELKYCDNWSEVYSSVTTTPTEVDSTTAEAEYDLVIVTVWGTLIILEAKSSVATGDTIKGKGFGAYQKSGPYGSAIFVNPLTIEQLQEDGTFKHYVLGTLKDMLLNAEKSRVEYTRFDTLRQTVKKKLSN